MILNDYLQALFTEGRFYDAVLGVNGIFIPDVTFRDKHDSLLVIRQMIILGCYE